MEGQTTCGRYERSAVKNGANIEEQLRICRSVATERGYVFVDDGVGGLGEPGPAWNSLMDLALSDARPFRVVVVRHPSRISRSEQVLAEQFVRLRDAGVEVVFER